MKTKLNLLITTSKLLTIAILFLSPSIGKFFFSIIFIFLLILIRIIFFKTLQTKSTQLISGFILLISTLPVLYIGQEFGPTFGMKIPFTSILWHQKINNNLKYYMAEDIIQKFQNQKLSKKQIYQILGNPDFEDEHSSEYLLRPEAIIGLAYAALIVEFKKDIVLKMYIVHPD